jgi:hypothetical protein
MRRGRRLRVRSGTLLPWTTPPYGYRSAPDCPRDPAGVRVEPIEGGFVQEIFVRYLEPQGSLLGLAKYLLGLGVPPPHGNPRWSAASLRGILTNPSYTGKLCVGRRRSRPPRTRRSATHPLGKPARGADLTSPEEWTFVGLIPALVTDDIFDQVQQKLALNMKQASRTNKSHQYLLRALVSCGPCLVINDHGRSRYVVPTHPRAETTRFCHLRKDYFHHVIEIASVPSASAASTQFSAPLEFGDRLYDGFRSTLITLGRGCPAERNAF